MLDSYAAGLYVDASTETLINDVDGAISPLPLAGRQQRVAVPPTRQRDMPLGGLALHLPLSCAPWLLQGFGNKLFRGKVVSVEEEDGVQYFKIRWGSSEGAALARPSV